MSTAKPVYLVDTNILLRFLMNDEPKHSPAAKKLLEQATSGQVSLPIPFITIAETIFTLQSFYQINRNEIRRELLKILNSHGVVLSCPSWITDAIDEYRINKVSFGDACLAAESRAEGFAVATFDKDLGKFTAVIRLDPLT